MTQDNKKQVSLDPKDFVNVEPIAKVGCTYPNLFTQASNQNRKAENWKEQIVKEVEEMKFQAGIENVEMLLDALYLLLTEELTYVDGDGEGKMLPAQTTLLRNRIFSLICMTKSILHIMEYSGYLTDAIDEMNLTKHKILL